MLKPTDTMSIGEMKEYPRSSSEEDTERKGKWEIATRQRKKSQKSMERYLEKYIWPKHSLFETHDEYIEALECGVKRFRQRGYPDNMIADALHNNIMTTTIAKKYLHTQKQHDTTKVEGVMKAIVETDKISNELSLEEKFTRLTMKDDDNDYQTFIISLFFFTNKSSPLI